MSNGTPRTVLIMNGVLAGLGVILGGAALADYVGPDTLGLLLLIYSGVTVAWGVVTQSLVTPNAKVAALAEPAHDAHGVRVPARVVAGPYIAERTSLNEGEPVDVTAQGQTDWAGGGPAAT